MVAIIGSRYFSAQTLLQYTSQIFRAVWSSPVITGCCPTGADQAARVTAIMQGWAILPLTAGAAVPTAKPRTLIVYKAPAQTPAALHLRTVQLIAAATSVIAFPISVNVPYSGSWLGIFQAAIQGKPVSVFLPTAQAHQLPTCHNITGWQYVPCSHLFGGNMLAGMPGFFQPITPAYQLSLFKG
jgi:hypothetical protein